MKKINVWVVDDEEDLGLIFKESFESDKIVISYYKSPEAVLEALKQNDSIPDAFFLDYRMPGIDGVQLASQLPSRIPKFLITGELEMSCNIPFNDILIKPYNFNKVLNILSNIQQNHY